MICDERKFIFTRVAKTGTSSIKKHLFPKKQGQDWKVHRDNINTKIKNWENYDPNHYPMYKIKEVITEEKYNNYFKFGFVRNPYDRCVSAWKYDIEKGFANSEISLFNFVKNLNPNHINSKYLNQYKFIDGCDFIGRFESLQEDFNIVCDKIGVPRQELPYKNKSNHKHYSEYYDDETREIVAQKYSQDIEYFGYKF